ncbi:MAG TPA: alpha/beta hydrolase [Cryobacterium sp.]|nr:alpha/beta hydrolase [Cryobacterium sp.]
MTDGESRGNPFALPGAEEPRIGWYDVNGCRLYAEVRGAGPPVLIIGAASDDAEMFRPIAERLTGFTVVTWDPRGTLRSGREAWPCDSARHADDAAALLQVLGLAPAAVFGASAGGIVALQLALRHPSLVRQVLVFEPGYFRHTPAGVALLDRVNDAVREHLAAHPGDWEGAMSLVSRAASARAASAQATPGLLDAPAGLEWYAERGAALAENFIRDDLPRTMETVQPGALAASRADIRFSAGTESPPVFREIAAELTRLRRRPGTSDPRQPDGLPGAGHVACFTPATVADYIRRRCTALT